MAISHGQSCRAVMALKLQRFVGPRNQAKSVGNLQKQGSVLVAWQFSSWATCWPVWSLSQQDLWDRRREDHKRIETYPGTSQQKAGTVWGVVFGQHPWIEVNPIARYNQSDSTKVELILWSCRVSGSCTSSQYPRMGETCVHGRMRLVSRQTIIGGLVRAYEETYFQAHNGSTAECKS